MYNSEKTSVAMRGGPLAGHLTAVWRMARVWEGDGGQRGRSGEGGLDIRLGIGPDND